MDKKYIFFDIDGTLTIKETGEVLESTKLAIQKLKENGHFVCIATGRAYYKTKEISKMLGIENLVTNGGGGLVLNHTLVKNQPLDKKKAIAIINEATSLGYGVLVAYNDSIDVIMKDDLFIKQVGGRHEPTNYILKEDINFNDLDKIMKIYISIPKEKEHLLALKDTLGNMRFHPDYLMYQYDKKDQGIKEILEIVHGNDQDTIVFGDDTNDLVMFKDEWYKVCMGNGHEKLKEKADFITKASDDDGIYYACEKLKLI